MGILWSAGLALVLFAVISCASPEPVGPPTPTPDVPRFAKGEATVLVRQRALDGVVRAYELGVLLSRLGQTSLATHGCVDESVRVAALDNLTESYSGNGRWVVAADARPDSSEGASWRVYEASLAIEPMNTSSHSMMGC